MFADELLTGIVSQHSLQNSPLESSCVVVALIGKCSTSKPLKCFPEKSQILSCDTLVTKERYNTGICFLFVYYNEQMHSYIIQAFITTSTSCNLHKVTVVIYRVSIKSFSQHTFICLVTTPGYMFRSHGPSTGLQLCYDAGPNPCLRNF